MNTTQTKEIRTERGRAALDAIIKELNLGGYICRESNDTRAALYDSKGDTVRAVPVATMERIASMNEYRTFTRRREWGDRVYIGREGHTGHFNDLINREHCKSIADGLSDYVNGRAFRCCECGRIHFIDDSPRYRCMCGFDGDLSDYDQQSLYDYFEDILDIEYRCDSRRELRSVQIMVACGGPNIYIDTASQKVELYWWGDSANWPLDSDTVAAVDEWAEEYWGCL